MKEKQSYNFLVGLILGTMACLIIWYWQKSTQAEDGALDLLDRLKAAELKLRDIRDGKKKQPEPELNTAVSPSPDNLQQIKGIGPVFATRLQEAGIHTILDVAKLSANQLAELLAIHPSRAKRILVEAGNGQLIVGS